MRGDDAMDDDTVEQPGHGEVAAGPGAAAAQYEQAKAATQDALRKQTGSFILFVDFDGGIRALGSFTGAVLASEDVETIDLAGIVAIEFLERVSAAAQDAHRHELRKFMERRGAD